MGRGVAFGDKGGNAVEQFLAGQCRDVPLVRYFDLPPAPDRVSFIRDNRLGGKDIGIGAADDQYAAHAQRAELGPHRRQRALDVDLGQRLRQAHVVGRHQRAANRLSRCAAPRRANPQRRVLGTGR